MMHWDTLFQKEHKYEYSRFLARSSLLKKEGRRGTKKTTTKNNPKNLKRIASDCLFSFELLSSHVNERNVVERGQLA